jgi:uncharacterized protein with GYD domain
MAKYIMLLNWTDQGVRTIKDSPERLDGVKALAKKMGGKIEDFHMTMGAYDMVITVDMPSDDAMAKLILTAAQAGNVRSTTLKAFTESAYRSITGSFGAAKKKKK